ncbi:MAG: hypothetical protein EBU46_20250 [Nitrosomonadaceae bacterium]|nr:hypothetical protein [Nitrosomonadaceae bacterium]
MNTIHLSCEVVDAYRATGDWQTHMEKCSWSGFESIVHDWRANMKYFRGSKKTQFISSEH